MPAATVISIGMLVVDYRTHAGVVQEDLGDRFTANNYDPNDLGLVIVPLHLLLRSFGR